MSMLSDDTEKQIAMEIGIDLEARRQVAKLIEQQAEDKKKLGELSEKNFQLEQRLQDAIKQKDCALRANQVLAPLHMLLSYDPKSGRPFLKTLATDTVREISAITGMTDLDIHRNLIDLARLLDDKTTKGLLDKLKELEQFKEQFASAVENAVEEEAARGRKEKEKCLAGQQRSYESELAKVRQSIGEIVRAGVEKAENIHRNSIASHIKTKNNLLDENAKLTQARDAAQTQLESQAAEILALRAQLASSVKSANPVMVDVGTNAQTLPTQDISIQARPVFENVSLINRAIEVASEYRKRAEKAEQEFNKAIRYLMVYGTKNRELRAQIVAQAETIQCLTARAETLTVAAEESKAALAQEQSKKAVLETERSTLQGKLQTAEQHVADAVAQMAVANQAKIDAEVEAVKTDAKAESDALQAKLTDQKTQSDLTERTLKEKLKIQKEATERSQESLTAARLSQVNTKQELERLKIQVDEYRVSVQLGSSMRSALSNIRANERAKKIASKKAKAEKSLSVWRAATEARNKEFQAQAAQLGELTTENAKLREQAARTCAAVQTDASVKADAPAVLEACGGVVSRDMSVINDADSVVARTDTTTPMWNAIARTVSDARQSSLDNQEWQEFKTYSSTPDVFKLKKADGAQSSTRVLAKVEKIDKYNNKPQLALEVFLSMYLAGCKPGFVPSVAARGADQELLTLFYAYADYFEQAGMPIRIKGVKPADLNNAKAKIREFMGGQSTDTDEEVGKKIVKVSLAPKGIEETELEFILNKLGYEKNQVDLTTVAAQGLYFTAHNPSTATANNEMDKFTKAGIAEGVTTVFNHAQEIMGMAADTPDGEFDYVSSVKELLSGSTLPRESRRVRSQP